MVAGGNGKRCPPNRSCASHSLSLAPSGLSKKKKPPGHLERQEIRSDWVRRVPHRSCHSVGNGTRCFHFQFHTQPPAFPPY